MPSLVSVALLLPALVGRPQGGSESGRRFAPELAVADVELVAHGHGPPLGPLALVLAVRELPHHALRQDDRLVDARDGGRGAGLDDDGGRGRRNWLPEPPAGADAQCDDEGSGQGQYDEEQLLTSHEVRFLS